MPSPNVQLISYEERIAPSGMNICVLSRGQNEKPLHYHDFNELVLIMGGSCTHVIDGKIFQLSRGDVFLLTPGTQHAYLKPNNLRLTNILYTVDALQDYRAKLEKLPGYVAMFKMEPSLRAQTDFKARMTLEPEPLEELERMIFFWQKELQENDTERQLLSELYLVKIILFLEKRFGQTNGKDESRNLLLYYKMEKFINDNFQNNIGRDDIIAQASLSRTTATRLFSFYSKQTPMQYLLNVRLNHACTMLQQTTRTITEIAYDCGFNDGNYFSLQFHKHIGLSPRDYRKQRQNITDQTV